MQSAGCRSMRPPHKKVAGDNAGEQTGTRKQRHAKAVLAPVQIDEGKKNPKSGVEEAYGPAGQGKGTAEEMSKAEAELVCNVAPANQRQHAQNEDQGRHGNGLLFNKEGAGHFLLSSFRYLSHAEKAQSIARKVDRKG